MLCVTLRWGHSSPPPTLVCFLFFNGRIGRNSHFFYDMAAIPDLVLFQRLRMFLDPLFKHNRLVMLFVASAVEKQDRTLSGRF